MGYNGGWDNSFSSDGRGGAFSGGGKIELALIFLLFLKIGTVGFGGGPALISIIQQEVVEKKKWIPEPVFLQGLAIALIPPGSLMVNIAFFVGGILRGTIGGVAAILGILLPSFILMIALAAILTIIGTLQLEVDIVRGLTPAVVGVLLAMVLRMTREHVKFRWGYLIIAGAAAAMFGFNVPPYIVLIVVFMIGIVTWFTRKKPLPGVPVSCVLPEIDVQEAEKDVIPPVEEIPCPPEEEEEHP